MDSNHIVPLDKIPILDVIKNEFPHNESKKRQAVEIVSQYNLQLRSAINARGDGNCFLRAILRYFYVSDQKDFIMGLLFHLGLTEQLIEVWFQVSGGDSDKWPIVEDKLANRTLELFQEYGIDEKPDPVYCYDESAIAPTAFKRLMRLLHIHRLTMYQLVSSGNGSETSIGFKAGESILEVDPSTFYKIKGSDMSVNETRNVTLITIDGTHWRSLVN